MQKMDAYLSLVSSTMSVLCASRVSIVLRPRFVLLSTRCFDRRLLSSSTGRPSSARLPLASLPLSPPWSPIRMLRPVPPSFYSHFVFTTLDPPTTHHPVLSRTPFSPSFPPITIPLPLSCPTRKRLPVHHTASESKHRQIVQRRRVRRISSRSRRLLGNGVHGGKRRRWVVGSAEWCRNGRETSCGVSSEVESRGR